MNTPLMERLRMAALDGNKLCSEAAAELEYALIQLQYSRNGECAALHENERLRSHVQVMANLLSEWKSTELDSQDEEFDLWIEQFSARVNSILDEVKSC